MKLRRTTRKRSARAWPSALAALLASVDHPTAILDHRLNIVEVNSRLERLLGWDRADLVRVAWEFRCVPPERCAAVRARLLQAARGMLGALNLVVLTRDGQQLDARVRVQRVGERRTAALILTIVDSHPLRRSVPPAYAGELQCDVSVSSADATFGRIERAWASDPSRSLELTGRHCYRVLFQRESRCPGCPAAAAAGTGIPQLAIMRSPGAASPFSVVTAHRIDGEVVRVGYRRIDDDMLGALVRAKLDHLADRGGLSAQERRVLELLALGRSLAEIARVLDIKPRTAKYHQANVLEKLQADSRADLIRLLL